MTEKKEIDNASSLISALGGTKGLLDSGLPALVFVLFYTFTKNLQTSIWAAVGLAGVLTVVRLVRRDTLQHAISGLLGVAICAFLAGRTGKAEDFYLPGLFINIGYGIAYTIGNLVRWPLFGLLIGAIQGEGTAWRSDPAKVALYQRIGWLWAAMFGVRVAVQYPLYMAGAVTELGFARVVMGWPLFLAVGFMTWRILKRG